MIFPRPCFHLGLPAKPVATWGLGIAVPITEDFNPEYGFPATIPEDGVAADRVIEILPGAIPSALPEEVGAERLEPVAELELEIKSKKGLYKVTPVRLYRRSKSGLDRLGSSRPGRQGYSGPESNKRDCP